jgi:hypothetical protein
MFSGKTCGITHHPCGRSSYSTSSTGLFRAARRFPSSRDASISPSAVPTSISVLGQDTVKGIKAPDTRGSVHDTPESPTYALFASLYADTSRMSLPPCTPACSLMRSDGCMTNGAMATTLRGDGLPDCKTRCVNTTAVARRCQSRVSCRRGLWRTDRGFPRRCRPR